MLLAAASTFAFDQDYIKLTTYASYEDEEFDSEISLVDMKAGDVAYVLCSLENPSDSTYHAFELLISLPDGLKLEPIWDDDEEEYFNSRPLKELSRSNRWTYKDSYNEENNTLKTIVFTSSPDKYSFPAASGKYAGPELFYFAVKATDNVRNDFAPLAVTKIIFTKSVYTGEEIDGKPVMDTEPHYFPNIYNLYYSVGESKYSTLCYNAAIDFAGSELTANVAKNGHNGYAYLTPVEVVPAGAPVVVTGEPGSYMLNAKYGEFEADAAFDGNELLGTANEPLIVDGNNIFALAAKNEGVGFYRCAVGVLIPRYKAYFETADAVDAMLFEETTGIQQVNAAEASQEIYTISGIKVNDTKQKGIYVTNGKKVVVK